MKKALYTRRKVRTDITTSAVHCHSRLSPRPTAVHLGTPSLFLLLLLLAAAMLLCDLVVLLNGLLVELLLYLLLLLVVVEVRLAEIVFILGCSHAGRCRQQASLSGCAADGTWYQTFPSPAMKFNNIHLYTCIYVTLFLFQDR